MRIGIYGGTFNPPHIGHVRAAQEAGRILNLDKLLIMPDSIPPHKMLPEGSPSTQQRFEMAQLAFGAVPGAEVSDLEMRRSGKSYTVHTVREIHDLYPDAELYLFMGSDMLKILHEWYMPEEVMRLCRIVTFARGDEGERELFDQVIPELEKEFGADITLIPIEALKASSTEIRDCIKNGTAEHLVPECVLGYIRREHLYGDETDLKTLSPEELRPIAMSYLKHKRMRHVLGTEEEAVRLAKRYGADERKARIAALLHDCTKKLDMEQQLALCETYSISLDALEQKALKLLHAKTGAEIARDIFGVEEDVYEAIKWHTTGKANMSLLEKIIYLADYIEPTRDFPGVEELRETVYRDLDEGMILGLEMTVEEMAEWGNPVHEKTLEALGFLKGQR